MVGLSSSRELLIRGVLEGSLSDSDKSRVFFRLGVSPDEVAWCVPPSRFPEVDRWDADVASVLSSPQISPQQASGPLGAIRWAEGGRSVKITVHTGQRAGGGVRRAITGFSARSRNGLLHLVNSLDRRAVDPGEFRFVTLTYPENYPDARSAKRDLDNVLKRFFRCWGPRGLISKLEPQKRGAPHFHLLILMGEGPGIEQETAWWARAWAEVVGSGDPNHERWHMGTLGNGNKPCVSVPREWNGVLSYVGKYLGKTFDGDGDERQLPAGWASPGRFWGVRHRGLLPLESSQLEVEERHRAVLMDVRRACVRYIEHQPSAFVWVTPNITGQRVRMRRAAAVDLAKRITCKIEDIRRRWKRSTGGVSTFMPSETFARVLAWACAKNGLGVEDLYRGGGEPRTPVGAPPAPF